MRRRSTRHLKLRISPHVNDIASGDDEGLTTIYLNNQTTGLIDGNRDPRQQRTTRSLNSNSLTKG